MPVPQPLAEADHAGADLPGAATLITNIGALVIDGTDVAWVGLRTEAPAADRSFDAQGLAAIPGFVDSHSRLVFAGDRTAEVNARMSGHPYSAGGIRTTVEATRTTPDGALHATAGHHVPPSHVHLAHRAGVPLVCAGQCVVPPT